MSWDERAWLEILLKKEKRRVSIVYMLKTSVPGYFKKRRDILAEKAGNAALIFASNPIQRRNHDVDYAYRQDSSFYYLSGFEEPNAFLVILPGDSGKKHRLIMFVQERNMEQEIWIGERYGVERVGDIFGADESYSISQFDAELPKILAKVDKVYVQLGIHPLLDQRIVPLIKQATDRQGRTGKSLLTIHDTQSIVGEMRLFKTEEETQNMRKACSISAKAHMQVMKDVRPGMNEFEVEAMIDYHFRRQGCGRNGYGSIVASGDNATCLHYHHNNRAMEAGQLLLIDAGGEYDYYTADITRTYPVGRTYTKEQARVYDAVLHVQKKCIEMVKPGVTYTDIQNEARKLLVEELVELKLLKGSTEMLLEKKAYHRFYPHNIGHWLGMDVHDTGLYNENGNSRKLEAGMVVTIEPGIYVQPFDEETPKEFRGIGVRIEDDVLVTKSGHEVLTSEAIKDRSEIENVRKY